MAAQIFDYSQTLSRFSIFYDLSSTVRKAITVTPVSYDEGKIIFREGDPITHVYLVLSGQVSLERRASLNKNKLIRQIGPYQVLGRLELDTLEGQLGTATVVEPCKLLLIDKQTLIELRDNHPELSSQFDRSEVIGQLRAIPYLAPLSDLEIKWISDIVTVAHAEAGETLYKAGRRDDRLLIIRQGRVHLKTGGNKTGERWVSAGAVLGDRSTIREIRRSSTAVTETKCHYYALPGDDLRLLARLYPNSDWLSDPIRVEVELQHAPLFQRLQPMEIRHLAGYTMQLHFKQPEYNIIRQGKADYYYYILSDGSAKMQQVREGESVHSPAILYPGSSFGETSLLLGETATTNVETRESTNWLRIHRKDFRLFLDEHPEAETRLNIDNDLRARLKGLDQKRKWQQEGEIILMQTRRHWIVLLRNLGMVFGAYLLLILCNLAVSATLTIPFGLQWLGPLAVFCLPMPVAFWVLLDYLNDWHIVTSRRIVHEEKVILISERRASAPLDKIQNLESKRSFLARLLSYGHLVINTAAEVGEIVFDFLPHTAQVTDLINKEAARARAGVRAESEELIRRQLQDRLHIGLEERTSERALIEEPVFGKKEVKSRQLRLPYKMFVFGLQEKPDNRVEWRKHWLALLLGTIWPLFLTVICVMTFTLVISDTIFQGLPPEIQNGIAVLSLSGVLVGFAWLWWSWTDWDNDRYILTDKHIEHIEQKPLFFDEERQITTYERVQNVEFRKPNPLFVLLNFGYVDIQTAATEGMVTFRYVPEPDFVQMEIYHRIERYRDKQAEMRQKQQKSEMIDWLDAYHKLVRQDKYYNSTG